MGRGDGGQGWRSNSELVVYDGGYYLDDGRGGPVCARKAVGGLTNHRIIKGEKGNDPDPFLARPCYLPKEQVVVGDANSPKENKGTGCRGSCRP